MAKTLRSKKTGKQLSRKSLRSRQAPSKLQFEHSAKRQGFTCIAGVDEVGRGSLAGPVVAAATILKDVRFKARIDDSKLLSPNQRNKAFAEIINKAYIGIGIVDHRIIDAHNISKATGIAMEKAIANLGAKPDIALVDGNVKFNSPCKIVNIIKGDQKSLSIACASIIAKVIRDNIISVLGTILYPEFKFNTHKGYGTDFHMGIIKQLGPTPMHRKSFNLYKKQ